ncbi:MAG: type II secretion system protein GspE, partial [Aeromonas sp.]|nr:type II secretion system protein GspE [Aeromonas sp.]
MAAYQLDGTDLPAALPELPFAFARNFGVVLTERQGTPLLLCRPGVAPQTLLEVRRVAGCAFEVEQLENDAFEELLMAHYQRDSSEARQLMEDLGNEMDFF